MEGGVEVALESTLLASRELSDEAQLLMDRPERTATERRGRLLFGLALALAVALGGVVGSGAARRGAGALQGAAARLNTSEVQGLSVGFHRTQPLADAVRPGAAGPIRLPRGTTRSAVVTVASFGMHYLAGVAALHHSYLRTCSCSSSCVDFVALLGPGYGRTEQQWLVDIGIIVVPVAALSQPQCNESARWKGAFTKLHIWGLTEYELVVFLDPDTVILQDISDLFRRPPSQSTCVVGFADSCGAINGTPAIHGGVMVFRPRLDIYMLLLEALHKTCAGCGDQELLSAVLAEHGSDLNCSIGTLQGAGDGQSTHEFFMLKRPLADPHLEARLWSPPRATDAMAAYADMKRKLDSDHPHTRVVHFVGVKPSAHEPNYTHIELIWWMSVADAMMPYMPSNRRSDGKRWFQNFLLSRWRRWNLKAVAEQDLAFTTPAPVWTEFVQRVSKPCHFGMRSWDTRMNLSWHG